METQYVDMYLRRKRGAMDSAVTSAAAHAETSTVDRQMDSVLRSAAGVQSFVDRIEDVAAHVDGFEERMANLTKLVKLAQTLHDEKEGDLRKQNQELKARLKRQEAVTYRLEREVEELKGLVHQQAHKAVAAHVEPLASDVATLRDTVKELRSSTMRVDNTVDRVSAMEARCEGLDHALSELMAAFKDGARQHAAQNTELTQTMRGLADSQDTARQGLSADVQGIKEWATRNLSRLKKHVDLLNADLTVLRDSHVETTTQLQKVQAQADNEHEKLIALLQQKSREANILTDIVDKEIQSIHSITQHHRSGLGQKLSAGINGSGLIHGGEAADANATMTSAAPTGPRPQPTAAHKSRTLFDDLAFPKR